MTQKHIFKKDEIIKILDSCLNKTLGEVDSNNVFDKTINKPKITGIAGDVIEQSVLGYPADNRQEPDLDIEGIKTELKTTGIKYKNNKKEFVAKEPMSITAVSPNKIIDETFLESNFWHKLKHILFVYYLYDSPLTVKASQYANFPIKGYQFHEFDSDDTEILKKDWETVRDFIKYLQDEYENYEDEYPRISHELRPKLMYIDTAPKWPNHPRFRLKRTVVSSIIKEHFGKKMEQLPGKYTSISEIDETCHKLSEKYSGKSIEELVNLLDIHVNIINKSIGEQIIVKMFGGQSKKMQNIELFNKSGIIGKTLTLTERGLRKEDMKLFTIDFEEFYDKDSQFEDSQMYDYFTNNRFLCIIFKKPHKDAELKENKFLGFKMINFDEDFIENDVKQTWSRIKDLIINNKLENVVIYDRNGNPRKNNNGVIMSAPNFPKSSEGNVFVRGTSSTSDVKPLNINGIQMYNQQIWIKGLYIVEKLNKESYL
ncbi:MutH/Sau3AI family endonuclease [Methanobrevibacter sp.]|uniref:MutH/Sau3AI family endonuclease n=1 Tax=Methanobrevibacter sp. TaxID=66852 RepID=UPI0038637610